MKNSPTHTNDPVLWESGELLDELDLRELWKTRVSSEGYLFEEGLYEELALRSFIKIVETDSQKATKLLEQLNDEVFNYDSVASSFLLFLLEAELEHFSLSDEKRLSIFKILVSISDKLSKLSVNIKDVTDRYGFDHRYEMYIQCESLTVELLRTIAPSRRATVLFDAVTRGNAFIWLLYFMRSLLSDQKQFDKNHCCTSFWFFGDNYRVNKVVEFVDGTDDLWLTQIELMALRRFSLDRLKLDSERNLSSPVAINMLLFWLEVGDNIDKSQLKSWIQKQTHTNVGFLQFVQIFLRNHYDGLNVRGFKRFDQINLLKKFIDLDLVIQRLRRFTDRNFFKWRDRTLEFFFDYK